MIRAADPSDAAALAEVLIASWRSAYAGLMPAEVLAGLDVNARTERWQEILTTATDSVVLVAEQDDRIVGFVTVGPSLDASPGADLYAIYVLESWWGRGVGHALHEAGLAALREQGHATAGLWVLRSNTRAIAFYASHGWTPDGREQIDSHLAGVELDEIGFRRAL